MSKRKSRVWMFFEQPRGRQSKTANTTSINNHIKYKHPTLYLSYVLLSNVQAQTIPPSLKSQQKNYLKQCLLRQLQCHQRSV